MKILPFLPAVLLLASCVSAGAQTTWFVDPAKGDDARSGTSAAKAWKSFDKINAMALGPGDHVVVAPGIHAGTLHPKAKGSAAAPAVIEFLPGTHEFAPEKALRRPLYVSNSCDAPAEPKPLGILVENCVHLRLRGAAAPGKPAGEKPLLLMGGRMVEAANLDSEDIAYEGLAFDLKRPTVSECRVVEAKEGETVVQVAEGSTYEIKDGKFAWTGDLGNGWVMAQAAFPETTRQCSRMGRWNPFAAAVAADLGGGKVRLSFKGRCGEKGQQWQFRHVNRDSVGIHNARSKDIRFEDCDIHALTNMGFVSQFTENITYRRVRVAPPAGTLRTCPAWGDIFQFSNCKGDILVEECVESGMQDDAINCHGTHLRIVGKPADNQLKLRYMHPQTYGFRPYIAGDEIAVIDHMKLRELPGNPRRKVTDCVQSDKEGREWTVTLDGPAPAFGKDNVVDNITWHPDLTARNNRIDMDSCRGFLLTTRGKVVVEGNTFHRCAMPGILIEDDARGWFESTCVRDMLIRGNRFVGCGIEISPQTVSNDPKEPVHENIRIVDNVFEGGGISVRGVKGLVVTGNKTPQGAKVGAHVAPSCSEVKTD